MGSSSEDFKNIERKAESIEIKFDSEYKCDFPDNAEIIDSVNIFTQKALTEVEDFYNVSFTRQIKVFIIDREGMNRLSGRETEPWVRGISSSKGIFLLDPRLYLDTATKYNKAAQTNLSYSDEYLYKLIKHELGHEAFGLICGIPFKDRKFFEWFNDGTQLFICLVWTDVWPDVSLWTHSSAG